MKIPNLLKLIIGEQKPQIYVYYSNESFLRVFWRAHHLVIRKHLYAF